MFSFLRSVSLAAAAAIGFASAAAAQPPSPCVLSDCNRDCTRTVQDIFDYLQSYFALCTQPGSGQCICKADANNDGVITTQDIFDFLAAFFGCPTGALPDLAVTIDSWSPTIIDPGCPFDLIVQVRNVGIAPACGTFIAGALLSIDSAIGGGDDTPWFDSSITLNPPLLPGESRLVTLPGVSFPGPLFIGTQHLFVCLDRDNTIPESNESNNCDSALATVDYDDVQTVSVAAEDPIISGNSVRIDVTLRSFTSCQRTVPVQIALCGTTFPMPSAILPGLATVTLQYFITVPGITTACGSPAFCTLGACANLAFDRDHTNDCASTSVSVANPYWALNFAIISAPISVQRGGQVLYTVRVTNGGSTASPGSVCARTGVCLNCGNFTQCIGGCGTPNTILFNILSLNPGASRDFNFFVNVCPNAFTGTQFVQAGIDIFDGCCDLRGNNNACRDILILP